MKLLLGGQRTWCNKFGIVLCILQWKARVHEYSYSVYSHTPLIQTLFFNIIFFKFNTPFPGKTQP